MANKRLADRADIAATFAAPLAPFGQAELMQAQVAMSEIAPEWLVELHGFCSSEATLVLVPDSGQDAVGPSFLISRETYGLRVDQIHWDKLTEVGVFPSLAEALSTLRLCLVSCLDWPVQASMTIH